MSLSESNLKAKVLYDLSTSFNIREQWPGKCFGNNVIIDALIKPKDTTGWKNKDVIFGIEFKQFRESGAFFGDTTQIIKQAIDYSYSNFKGVGRIPILICPGLSIEGYCKERRDLHEQESMILRRVLAKFLIGELFYCHLGLSIVFASSHKVWTSMSGILTGAKQWSFIHKTGSGTNIKTTNI